MIVPVDSYLINPLVLGFQSKGSYLFGHFSMNITMVPVDSAGSVTAVYLSSQNAEHDEIDFEFLGNRTGQSYILQTNVFTGGQGNKDQFKQTINNISMLQRKKCMNGN